MPESNTTKVAIIYHYIAHYRLPIFKKLMEDKEVQYDLYSGTTSEIPIKKIDETLAAKTVAEGGLRWLFLKNIWIKNIILWQPGLIKLAFSGKYDAYIFLGNPYHLSTWFAAFVARLRGKKVYYWMHGIYSERLSAVDYIKTLLFYKIPHGYFLYGNRAFRRLEKLKVKPAHNMHVIYNSLDYDLSVSLRKDISAEEVQAFKSKYFKNTALPVAMFIGRVNIIKRIDLVIEAQRLLIDKGVAFNFLVVGDGEERKNNEELASKLGVSDYVSFYGASYDEAVNSYLIAASDLCITPGEVGLTAIHAMSYGTPVVSHDNFNVQMPEVEAIKPGKTGDFFTQDNSQSLANVIENWFKEHPYKTEELKNDCYKIVDHFFNPNFQANKLREVLSKNK